MGSELRRRIFDLPIPSMLERLALFGVSDLQRAVERHVS